jgi:tetratricopeptide (TPR) repeat protein
MNQSSPTPTPPRSNRTAPAGCAWAGLALTIVAAYLSLAGHVRIGSMGQLRAETPKEKVDWKSADNNKVELVPSKPQIIDLVPPEGFKPVTPPTISFKPVVNEEPVRPQQPAPIPVAPKPTPTIPATVPSPAAFQPVAPIQFTPVQTAPAPVPAPTKLPSTPPKVEAKPPELPPPTLPSSSNAATPKTLPPLPTLNSKPLVLPVAAQQVDPQPKDPPLLGPKIVQPDMLPILPKPVDNKENKEVPPKKRRLVGQLTQDDEIKLNAAQNAARLGDYPRAAALMADIISRNPREYDLRAEYAGILISAGDVKKAIAELEEVLKSAPKTLEYLLLLGDAYMIARDYRKAAGVFNSALEIALSEPRLRSQAPEVVIRSARAYAIAGDLMQSLQLIEKYLLTIRPEDPLAPNALGSLLLDINRPNDALPYLLAKKKQLLSQKEKGENGQIDSRLLELNASIVRAYGQLGERNKALEVITEMAPLAPTQSGVRVALGEILFETSEYELAGHVFGQVLVTDPMNPGALIGSARVYLEMFQPAMAKQLLDSFVPNQSNQRNYLMAYATYHQTVGEYAEAKQIYRDILRRNEADHEVRYAFGRLLEYTAEFEKAKGEFAKIPPQDKVGRRARLWFGFSLLHQKKLAEAAQVGDQFCHDDPNNPDAVAFYVRALAKLGQFDRAMQVGRSYLATAKDDRSATTVRLAVARAATEGNRALEAAREYEMVLSRPVGRVPEAYYGLARAAEKLGNVDKSQQILGTLISSTTTDIRNRVLLSDHFAEDYDDGRVIDLCVNVLNQTPENLAVMIRLADAQQRAGRWSGNPADSFSTSQEILRQSPTNVRGHLAMSRSFAITQNYRKASVQYDQLIAFDPDFTIPQRERARVLFSDHQYSAARSQYNVVLSQTPEEVVAAQITALRDGKLQQVFAPYMAGGMNGPALRAELAKIANSHPDNDIRHAAHRFVCDFDATVAWQEAFRLERDMKELKDYRNYMGIPQAAATSQFEPSNVEALFDHGQMAGNLRMTREALTWYSNCQAIDPTHRDSIVASERASAELSPKYDTRYEFFSQRGRDGLASMDRTRYVNSVTLPIGDENEYVQAGYMLQGYNPLDDRSLWGNVPFLRGQKKFDNNRLLTYGQINLEQYDRGFSTRPTFDAGFMYDHSDVMRTRGGLFLENVAESGESIRQDIFRYGGYAGLDFRPTRTWNFGGLYTYAHYSDENDMNMAYIYNENALTLPPKVLKLVQRANVWGYRSQSIFPTDPPDINNLQGTVHPYFAPDVFSSFEFRTEWWHWLSRDYFVHSNQCWYSTQYGIIVDNHMVTYHDVKVLFNYDLNSYVSVGAEGRMMLSAGQVYDLYSAMAYLQIRFLSK